MLEADEQDSLELQPPRAGKTHTYQYSITTTYYRLEFTVFVMDKALLYVSSCEISAIDACPVFLFRPKYRTFHSVLSQGPKAFLGPPWPQCKRAVSPWLRRLSHRHNPDACQIKPRVCWSCPGAGWAPSLQVKLSQVQHWYEAWKPSFDLSETSRILFK